MRFASFLLAATMVSLTASAQQAELPREPVWKRWAVVSEEKLRQSGVPDLLMAELSRAGIEMVEREQLALVTRELELPTLLGADAGKRLRLGQLLKADALVLLSLKVHKQKKSLQIVVSETRYGARLHVDFFAYDAQRLELLSRQCASAVAETRRRFATGIKHLICVTPFLSKNLSHEYDHLQTGYAALLESSLSRFAGVAAVEISEARAIAKELELSGGAIGNRVVPLYVEGEFKVVHDDARKDPVVAVTLRVRDSQRIRSQGEKSGLSQEEVATLLRVVVPKNVLRLPRDSEVLALDRKRQIERLTMRADRFAEVGIYEQSTALREAALLLDGDDVDLRLTLVSDYLNRAALLRALYQDLQRNHAPNRIETIRNGRRRWLHSVVPHVERLVRRRQVNPREANEMMKRIAITFKLFVAAGERDLLTDRKLLDDFFWRVIPVFPQLDPKLGNGSLRTQLCRGHGDEAPRTPSRQQADWTGEAVKFILYDSPEFTTKGRVDNKPSDQRTLDDLFRFLTEVLPPDTPVANMPYILQVRVIEALSKGRLSVAEFRQFYSRLRETGRAENVFYARYGDLVLDVYGTKDKTFDPSGLVKADGLKDAGNKLKRQASGDFFLEPWLTRLRKDIAERVGATPSEKRHSVPTDVVPRFDPDSPIAFDPVPDITPDWHQIINCDDKMDVMWSAARVYMMQVKGNLKKVFPVRIDRANEDVLDVAWDGENIWVAAAKSGITIVSPKGDLVARISADEGLPPYLLSKGPRPGNKYHNRRPYQPLIVHAIAPGKCLAIGTVGNDRRRWFASISTTGDKRRVEVFHSMTHVVRGPSAATEEDLEANFPIHWIAEYALPSEPGRRWLLLGRRGARPLTIDLDSLEVSLCPALPKSMAGSIPYVCVDGKLIYTGGFLLDNRWHTQIASLYLQDEDGRDSRDTSDLQPHASNGKDTQTRWLHKTILVIPPQGSYDEIDTPILAHDGQIFVPGRRWYRVDPKTMQVELIVPNRLPLQHDYAQYAVSSHYGLVAWNEGDRLYQVRIAEDPKQSLDMSLESQYPYVPAPHRETHDRVVRSIRKLGGRVDAVWGQAVHNLPGMVTTLGRRKYRPQWRTVVHLSDEWTGGDEGLAVLSDLYGLRGVVAVGANITDKGLSHLGKLTQLETLYLIDTQATDAGLRELQTLDELIHLRLEGDANGRRFSDAGLEPLAGCLKIEELVVYGRGYTNSSATYLQEFPKLKRLTAHNTLMTAVGLDRLKGVDVEIVKN